MNKQTEALKIVILFSIGFIYTMMLFWVGGCDFNIRGYTQACAIFISTMVGFLSITVVIGIEKDLL